ncbi:proSAAS-like [Pristis pectinata]|uniref:proSAAS-like n=1 Tax=Pristis pectinata TaxID=685728 RepID=UPI00223E85EC|nr:proSAAS-like [Pristis pectinata]
MMGPGLCSLLLSFCLALSSLQPAKSKTLPSMPEAAASLRHRRDALPYEAEMFAYPPGEEEVPRGEAAPSHAALGRLARLALALGRTEDEEDEEEVVPGPALRRRLEEREDAAYLRRLLRAWRELGLGLGYEGLPRGGGLLYGPSRGLDGGEEEGGQEEEEGGEEVLRYLLSRMLADVEAGGGVPGPRRVRRSPGAGAGTPPRDLLRVKRLRGGGGGPGRQEELLLVGQALSDGLSGRPRGRGQFAGTHRVRRSRSDVDFLPD